MNLRQQVGQLIIAGVEGTELSAIERAWLKLVRPGGVILFRRNIEQPSQVTALLRDVTEIAGAPLFRCVDLEGGLVDRLRDLIAPMPSPAAVFATDRRTNFQKHGRLIAQEAATLGFNTVFAPVLDLALPASSPVMRTRVVSANPEDVIEYGEAFIKGLDAEGVLGCGKHFPGLGGGTLDSHESTPLIERTRKDLWEQDIAVFRALAPKLPMIMVAHAAYPVAKNTTPASISPYWIATVLKRRIGFAGLVVSDDMEMGGILTQVPMEEAAVKAIVAGTDLIEICRDPALVLRAYEAVLAQAERSAVFRGKVEAAAARVIEHKSVHLDAAMPRTASVAQIQKLSTRVKLFAEKVNA
ncbi:MAG: beta-N-acetylhexosaminidase [Acidobacteriaceae bacterium]|nr:beta-N-acetylhexosaminidase [Acidobacteriaceae bacterium]